MSLFHKLRTNLRSDPLLQRVVRNSSYLFSSSAISAVLSAIQIILVARLLDPGMYGLATGIIMVFASNVNRFLSFRMSEVVVKYAGESLSHEKKDQAAALIKGIGITEALTSILAYLVLVLLSPWAANVLAKDISTTPLFIFYGLFLLECSKRPTSLDRWREPIFIKASLSLYPLLSFPSGCRISLAF
jgi:O-antigen/teichoic acid export membrane protein